MRRKQVYILITCLMLISLTCKLQSNISNKPGDTLSADIEGEDESPLSNTIGKGDSPEIPFEQRMTTLEEITDFLYTLPGVDLDAENQVVADYLASRPEFTVSGISPDGTVWAEFTDGRDFYFFNNRPFDPGKVFDQDQGFYSAPASSFHNASPIITEFQEEINRGVSAQTMLQSGPVELPNTNKVRMMNALGSWYGEWVDKPFGDINKMLQEHGYSFVDSEPTVDNLKNVSGDGIFIFNTHGGVVKDGQYGLWTSTQTNRFYDTKYANDLNVGRVAYAVAKHDKNIKYDPDRMDPNSEYCQSEEGACEKPYMYASHYAITGDFVKEYMSFGGNTLVVINACTSHSESIRNAFLGKKNVSVYAGWTNEVKADFSINTLALFIDRLLGVNKELPKENPEVRPFDAVTVQKYMKEKRKYQDPWKGATFEVSTSGSNSLILVPSIQFMEVHEDSDELFIFGMFGTDEGEVLINDTKADVINWKSDVVVVKLKEEGSGSAGDTIVKVGDHESNTVPLTEWRGKIHYEAFYNSLAPNLKLDIDMDVHLRADVHAARRYPWEDPQDRTIKLSLVDDSEANFKAYGSSTVGGAKFELTGSGSIPTLNDQPNHEKAHFDIFGVLKVSGLPQGKPPTIEDVNFHLHLSGDTSDVKLTIKIPNVEDQISAWVVLVTDILFDQTLTLDEKYNIQETQLESGTYKGIAGLGVTKLRWEQLDATYEPSLSKPPQAYEPNLSEGYLLAGFCMPYLETIPSYNIN